MSHYLILPLLAFWIHLILLYVVLRDNPRRWINRIFSLFLLSMALWGLTIYGMRSSPNLETAFRWEKWVFTWLAAAPAFFFHFTFAFTDTKPRRFVLPALYSALVLLVVLVHLGLVVEGMKLRPYGYAPVIGPLFPPYVLFVYSGIFLGVLNLWRVYRTSPSGQERNRLAYLLLGPIISFLGGTSDYVAALGAPIYPMGIVSNILFGILSTIAILKHQLLDIQLLVRRGTTYLILAGLAAGTYSLIFLLAYHLAGGPEFRELYFFTGLILVVAIAASFQPAVQWMSREVDRFFFQERWKPLRELQRFAQETKEITDISALARSLLSLTADAMKARGVYLLGPPLEGVSFSMGYQGGRCEPLELPVSWENPLMVWLNHQGCAVSARDLQALPQWQGLPSQEQKALLDLEGELFVPLKSKDSLVSLLVLGPKVGRKPYSQEEISLLETVAYQAATVIENAMLYEQLRRRLEELQRTQDQLIRSAKLAAVGELAASVAHEVNNPLQTILNITYLLAQDSTSEQVREDLKLIEKEVLRARGIVRSLLDFAHRGEAAWGLEDVNKAVESVLSLAKVRTEASGITVATNLEPALPPVWADGEQLKQVFLNIVTNALDAMPNGGTLTVTTRRVNDRLVVEFSDTGVGIPEEFLSRVFEPFFTTKPAGKGTGLGLAVSQSIVERHGGDISVRSQVGRGSTFTVSLPVSQDSKEV